MGAGGFWDAIEAMGGRRLTPAQSVDALSEAIDVIRGIWDVGERGGVRVDGEHYRVRGAKRGPEAAHDISIWVGAYKPRMLRLVGRKADGWLPSLAYTSLDALGPSNRTIDEAAVAAGRDPGEIRRLINIQGDFGTSGRGFLQGPPEQWVQDLLPLVVEHGFSTFLVVGDDPRTIEAYGHDVAPALREAVASARGAGGRRVGPPRGSAALAQRRDRIDYDALPDSLASMAIEPGDRGYGKVRSMYTRVGSPGLVVQAATVDDVVAALAFARQQDVALSVRSGGHGISGRSTNDGGIVIDVGTLDGVEVLDRSTGRVRLGAGARWGDVAQQLAPFGLAMSSGDYGDVGVGGLATTGGIGFLAPRVDELPDRLRAARPAADRPAAVRLRRRRHRGRHRRADTAAGDRRGARPAGAAPALLRDRADTRRGPPGRRSPHDAIGPARPCHPRAAQILEQGLRSGDAPMLQLRSVGGAVNDVGPQATAYAHRTQNFALSAGGTSRVHRLWDELSPQLHGLYLSFDTDRRPERLAEAFPGETLPRLRRLKARYDPDNVFNQNFPIPPAEHDEQREPVREVA